MPSSTVSLLEDDATVQVPVPKVLSPLPPPSDVVPLGPDALDESASMKAFRGGLFVALLEITGGKASIQVNGKTYRKNSRLILSGGSEIYQETLCKALAKHFGARLLIVDCLSLPGCIAHSYSKGDQAMAPGAKFCLLLKIIGLQKLGLGLINQFQMAMILEAFVRMIVGSFVLMTLKQLGRLFPNKVTIQLPQDEALLSDWKQQLERDIETMKVQSNIVSVCTIDRASMLDEAIEYLKQLQLQVQVSFGRQNLELDDDDLGVLHAGGYLSGVVDLLVKNETFHELGVVELLHNLDIAKINHVGLGGIHDEESGVDDEGSEEHGVLDDDLAIEGSAGRLHKGVAIRELDGDGHGGENIDNLEGSFVEGVGDDGVIDVVGEEEETLLSGKYSKIVL
ncbi:hypothetical protein JHK84_049969 [Glycine max]|nr:hypothetical protein JHK84_049969 [Glycine max]